jgi:hypothetical protein
MLHNEELCDDLYSLSVVVRKGILRQGGLGL